MEHAGRLMRADGFGRAASFGHAGMLALSLAALLCTASAAGAQDDDVEVAKVYQKAGATVSALDVATVGKWRDIARDTAWKDYGAKTATAANLLKLASDVSA